MQYTPAVLGFANGLQFRQWSSRGKEKIFFPQRTTNPSTLPCRGGSSPAVIVVLSGSLKSIMERREQEKKTRFPDARTTVKTTEKDSPGLTLLWLLLFVLVRSPSLSLRFQSFCSAFYSLWSSHIGSSRVFQISLAMSLMRSRGKTAKSPSPYLAMMN